MREQIKSYVETRTLFARGYKLIGLDEADVAMTTTTQSALRWVVEQYTENIRFSIICNSVNKIVPAIQSCSAACAFASRCSSYLRLRTGWPSCQS